MLQWVEAFNEDNLDKPIVPCTCIGFHPLAEGEASTVIVVCEDTRPHMMFEKTCFFLHAPLSVVFNCISSVFHKTLLSLNLPPRTPGPTAVGVMRMDCFVVAAWCRRTLGTCEWQHGQGTHGNGMPGLNS